MTRIVHCGDRQIGVGRSLERTPGGRLQDQEEVGQRIVEIVRECGADLLIDGGDIFEGPDVTDEHREAYMRPLERLAGSVPILAVLGNGRHDRSAKPANALQTLRHIPGFQAASRPDVYVLGGAAVVALPYVSSSRLRALYGGGDSDEIDATAADLALRIAEELFDACERVAPGLPRVLVPHWSISGASLPTGLPVDSVTHAVLPLAELSAIGYDIVLASHIHVPQAFIDGLGWRSPVGAETFNNAAAIYSGSPMPHDFGEANHAHGVWIIDVERGGSRAEFVPIESRPFVTLGHNLTDGTMDVDLARALLSLPGTDVLDGAIVRLRVTATSAQMRTLNTSALVDELIAKGAHVVKLDPHTVHESRARVTVERPDEITDAEWLDRWLELTETPDDAAADVRAVFAGYRETAA